MLITRHHEQLQGSYAFEHVQFSVVHSILPCLGVGIASCLVLFPKPTIFFWLFVLTFILYSEFFSMNGLAQAMVVVPFLAFANLRVASCIGPAIDRFRDYLFITGLDQVKSHCLSFLHFCELGVFYAIRGLCLIPNLCSKLLRLTGLQLRLTGFSLRKLFMYYRAELCIEPNWKNLLRVAESHRFELDIDEEDEI